MSDVDLEKQLEELAARNAQRVEEAKKRMGSKYLCHPSNFVTKEKYRKLQKSSVVGK